MGYIREDQADIRVSLDGVPYGDSWKEAEGGNLEAADGKTRPGGMGLEVSVGGVATRGDLTVRTQMSDIVATWHPTFEAAIEDSRPAVVSIHWLGKNKVPLGTSATRNGTVKAANLPNLGGSSDVGLYEVVISCDEAAA